MSTRGAQASPLEVVAAGETDRGRQRTVNEDAILVRGDIALYIVADGAGGHSAGNVASAIATSSVAKHFDDTEAEFAEKPDMAQSGLWNAARRLSMSVQRANAAVIEIARSSNKYRGMGTTIVCAHVSSRAGRLHIAHVGDSRCYRLRQKALEALTHDHSLLTDVLELHPELDDSAVAKLPRKAVTRALGMEESVRVSISTHRILPGDRYLLCSDGLTGELGEEMIAEVLGEKTAPAEVVQDLVRAAKEHGGRDNLTALVFDCMPVEDTGARSVKPPVPSRTRPAKTSPTPESSGATPASEPRDPAPFGGPEIVVWHRASEDSDPRISVVPANASDARMIQALDRVTDRLTPTRAICAYCHSEYEGPSLHCPRCGFATRGPRDT